MLDKSPIKWRQRLDMTIAVNWDVKHQFKQTKLITSLCLGKISHTSINSSVRLLQNNRHKVTNEPVREKTNFGFDQV